MAFSVKQALADLDLPPFPYEDADGEEQTLPHVKMLSPEQAFRVLYHGDYAGVINELGGQGDALAALPAAVLEQLVNEWLKHSDIDPESLGKLATPSPSGKGTATRSKRTSRSGGSRSRR